MNAKVPVTAVEEKEFVVGEQVVSAQTLFDNGYPLTPHGAQRYLADTQQWYYHASADEERAHFHRYHLQMA